MTSLRSGRATHRAGLRFYAGVACFSDHATNFRVIKKSVQSCGRFWKRANVRPEMEWYVGMTPTGIRRQEDVLARISSIARSYPIDGLFLDFMRWPLHWEIRTEARRAAKPRDSSFDTATLGKFEAFSGALR